MMKYRISVPGDREKKYTVFSYPAGEKQVRLNQDQLEKIKKASVIEITFQPTDGELMELLLMYTALSPLQRIPCSMQLVLPYLPYSRADRRFAEGDCFGLRSFGLVINALWFDKVSTYDVHSPVAYDYIRNLQEIPITPFVLEAVHAIGKRGLTVILPDKGARRYVPLVEKLKLPYVVAGKTRDPKTGALSGFEFPPVKISKGLIIDDICDGGGTFNGLADKIREMNPKAKLWLYVTHGIFSKGTAELRKRFEQVYSTDTIQGKIDFMENVSGKK